MSIPSPTSPLPPNHLTTRQLHTALRAHSRSLRNRLHSIYKDARFVAEVHEYYGLPLVVNRRAGEWYVDPRRRWGGGGGGSVYFKSTDGHAGSWGCSFRRLNLGLLETVGREGGAIVVDSTRRGKRYPDALAKTIPIWCAVINALLFPHEPLHFFTPPLAVSRQEHEQIRELIPGFVREFRELGVPVERERYGIEKPLRPLWVTPGDFVGGWEGEDEDDGEGGKGTKRPRKIFEDFTPLVLVTASEVVKGEGVEGEYIQGAGDDAENWLKNHNLTPATFWEHHEALLASEEPEVLIRELLPVSPSAPPSYSTTTTTTTTSSPTGAETTPKSTPFSLPRLTPILKSTILRGKSTPAPTSTSPATVDADIYILPALPSPLTLPLETIISSSSSSSSHSPFSTALYQTNGEKEQHPPHHHHVIIIDCLTPSPQPTPTTSTTPPKPTTTTTTPTPNLTITTLPLPPPPQKQKSNPPYLRTTLPDILNPTISTILVPSPSPPQTTISILIATPSPKDLSLAIALYILSLYFLDDGHLQPHVPVLEDTQQYKHDRRNQIDKQSIRRRLAWIVQACGEEGVDISRACLNAVNACLMDRRCG